MSTLIDTAAYADEKAAFREFRTQLWGLLKETCLPWETISYITLLSPSRRTALPLAARDRDGASMLEVQTETSRTDGCADIEFHSWTQQKRRPVMSYSSLETPRKPAQPICLRA